MTWIVIAITVSLFAIGIVRQMYAVRGVKKRIDEVQEFLAKFTSWCNGEGKDQDAYVWLQRRVNDIQGAVGATGVISYRPPFANYMFTNYQLLLNELPDIRRQFSEGHYRVFGGEHLLGQIHSVTDCLHRFIGFAEGVRDREKKRRWNPIVWLAGGVGWVLAIPVSLLAETGLLSAARTSSIVNSKLFSFAAFVAAAAAFLSTIMSIAMGWDGFVALLAGWFGQGGER